MIRIKFFFISTLFVNLIISQVTIDRLSRDPIDIFKLSDWKTYLSFDRVTDVTESQQYVYLATNSAGLLRFNKYRNQFDFPLTKSNGLLSNKILRIRELAVDTNMNFAKYAVIYHNTEFGEKRQIIDLDSDNNSLFRDDFFKNSPETDMFTGIRTVQFSERFNLDFPFSMNSGPEIIDENFQVYKRIYKYSEVNGAQWLFVSGLGLFRASYKAGTYYHFKSGPDGTHCKSFFLRNGKIFIAQKSSLSERGTILSVWDENNSWTYHKAKYIFGFSGSEVNRINSRNDTILLATNRGIISFKEKTGEFSSRNNSLLDDLAVNDLLIGPEHFVLATSSGLYKYYPNSGLVSEIVNRNFRNKNILRVAGNINDFFFNTRFEIFRYKSDSLTYFPDQVKQAFDISGNNFIEYKNQTYWFNNSSGVFFYKPETNEVKSIRLGSTSFNLKIRKVLALANNLFIATNNGLIIYYDKLRRWILLNEREGLPNRFISDLILDGDYLFILYPNGISEFKWTSIYNR